MAKRTTEKKTKQSKKVPKPPAKKTPLKQETRHSISEPQKTSLGWLAVFFTWLRSKKQYFAATIRRKKEERLTLMFIPHNERSIRNFHISNLTLTIVLSVVSVLLVVSSFLVIMHNSTVQEVDKMKISQKDAQLQFAKIREGIKTIDGTFTEVRNMISTLYAYAKGKDQADSLFAAGGVDVNAPASTYETGEASETDSIPLEVFLLERIADDMNISQEKLGDVQDFLKKREKIIKNTPTLWPVKGYIINPYGFVRSAEKLSVGYNYGVDIASYPGSLVQASAPGFVVSIQRDSRFMYTVKIRHNYGYETVYQGLERVSVSKDEKMSKGESIGYLGGSSDMNEAVLHYEIRIGVEPVDPMPYLSRIIR